MLKSFISSLLKAFDTVEWGLSQAFKKKTKTLSQLLRHYLKLTLMLVFLLLYNLAAKKNFVVNTLSTDIKKLLLLQVPLNGVENTDRAATTAESFFPFNFPPEF